MRRRGLTQIAVGLLCLALPVCMWGCGCGCGGQEGLSDEQIKKAQQRVNEAENQKPN